MRYLTSAMLGALLAATVLGPWAPVALAGPSTSAPAASGNGIDSRTLINPGSFTADALNSPTIGTITLPYPGLTLTKVYASGVDRLYYRELVNPDESWTYVAHVRGLTAAEGYNGIGVALQMSGGKYMWAGMSNSTVTFAQVQAVSRHAASGLQETVQYPIGAGHPDYWDHGVWLRVSYDSTANTLAAGAGEVTLQVGADGRNWDNLTAVFGNVASLGTVDGLGAGLVLTSATDTHTFTMILDSFEAEVP
jgi:hypothetical protein